MRHRVRSGHGKYKAADGKDRLQERNMQSVLPGGKHLVQDFDEYVKLARERRFDPVGKTVTCVEPQADPLAHIQPSDG